MGIKWVLAKVDLPEAAQPTKMIISGVDDVKVSGAAHRAKSLMIIS